MELSMVVRACTDMDPFANIFVESACSDSNRGSFGIERFPFLRNINEPTDLSFSSSTNMGIPVLGMRGPIFIHGPHFNIALRLFHGRGGVAPPSGSSSMSFDNLKSDSSQQFNPLAAKAATISLSGLGTGGPFGFDSFSQNQKKKNNKKSKVN
ncbi:hypothetical protein FCM35_KLT13780 [Carex littledalei]|uniref:Uncharacterized protein n=1 Tax=Carex littledalei TaxID=544730 RepID=A0A833QFF2_9POAL|nr:hypothetical protein FCM35_KLT13780 [Carex littledalei]